jgi:dATP pyrophosphohydrolase
MASDDKPEYAVTKRADIDAWQFLSGGGEDHETPIQAARREANEEGGIPRDLEFLQLDSVASIPVHNFSAHKEWGKDVYVIQEYSFCVDVGPQDLLLVTESQPAHNDESKAQPTALSEGRLNGSILRKF